MGQGGTGHAQCTFSSAVPTNEATGMNKDASRDPTDLVQGFIPKATPWLWQGQATSEQKEGTEKPTEQRSKLAICSYWAEAGLRVCRVVLWVLPALKGVELLGYTLDSPLSSLVSVDNKSNGPGWGQHRFQVV